MGALSALLTFFLSSWGRLIGAALIAGSLGYVAGYRRADRLADAANLKAQIATLKADAQNSRLAEIIANTQAEKLQKWGQSLEDKLNDIETDVRNSPPARRCTLGPDRARKLRGIR